MSNRGGKRERAGRKKGGANRITQEAVAKAMASNQETPLDYMLRIMRDEKRDDAFRFEAAKAAAPYIHHKLSTLENPVQDSPLSPEEPASAYLPDLEMPDDLKKDRDP
jgi:hypothetical protein